MKLTIYIPTYQRNELAACLDSIMGQVTDQVEVYVSDNDPSGFARDIVMRYDDIQYKVNSLNIGCDPNVLSALGHGSGEYLWVFGDDDIMLPGAIEATLQMCDGIIDRVIHFAPRAGEVPTGFRGHMYGMANRLTDKSFLVASTLCSMNVWRREQMNPYFGLTAMDTRNVICWAGLASTFICVSDVPYVEVGRSNQTAFPGFVPTMTEYIEVLQAVNPTMKRFDFQDANRWNYNNA